MHVNIIMLHVDINKSHVNIIMLHFDIIYLACRGQKYATIGINSTIYPTILNHRSWGSCVPMVNVLTFENKIYLKCKKKNRGSGIFFGKVLDNFSQLNDRWKIKFHWRGCNELHTENYPHSVLRVTKKSDDDWSIGAVRSQECSSVGDCILTSSG